METRLSEWMKNKENGTGDLENGAVWLLAEAKTPITCAKAKGGIAKLMVSFSFSSFRTHFKISQNKIELKNSFLRVWFTFNNYIQPNGKKKS